MKNNDEKVKELMNNVEIPEELEPDNIKLMLDEKAAEEKRGGIKHSAGRITAAAAACAVIVGGAAAVNKAGLLTPHNGVDTIESSSAMSTAADPETESFANTVVSPKGAFMESAESYQQIYDLMSEARTNRRDNLTKYEYGDNAESSADMPQTNGLDMAAGQSGGMGGGGDDYSTVFNQEENVLESDVYQTDGHFIYRLTDNSELMIAETENGKFINSSSVDINSLIPDNPLFDDQYAWSNKMFLYNDKLIVISTLSYAKNPDAEDDSNMYYNDLTRVSVLTTGIDPQLVDVYYQDGYCSDTRISPEGYLYLITNFGTYISETEEYNESMIPWCGMDEPKCVDAGNILLPDEGFSDSYYPSFTVIGALDLNGGDSVTVSDVKALAGYSGIVYCSEENLYTAYGWESTDITRFSISGGSVTPAASCTIKGFVNDQFSMSEYNGTFRVASTDSQFNFLFAAESTMTNGEDSENVQNNYLYVFDMDLNELGCITDFGIDESIQSVNFNGDMAYVVTFRRTDPLYAIDLSDPANPVITSELKINGFSTYMQKWDENTLLGFGIDADDDGVTTGIKASMFDNSDPENLSEIDKWTPERNTIADSFYSAGAYERKALLIAPEKNIIGFPLYSDKVTPLKGRVTTENDPLNVREWAYKEAEIIGTIDKGAEVTVLDNWGDFYQIDYNGKLGYVDTNYVTLEDVNGEPDHFDYHDTAYKYVFLSFENGKFTEIGSISEAEGENKYSYYLTPDRALYIGDHIYVLSQCKFTALDMNTMEETDSITFENEFTENFYED